MNEIEFKKNNVLTLLEMLMKYVVKYYRYSVKEQELPDRTEEKYSLPNALKDIVKRVVIQMKDSNVVKAYRRLYTESDNCSCRQSYMLELYDKDRTDSEFVVEVIKACTITAALFKIGYGYSPDSVVDRIRAICYIDDRYEGFRTLGCENDSSFHVLDNLMKRIVKYYDDCVEGRELSHDVEKKIPLPNALSDVVKRVVVQMKDSPLLDKYIENRVCRCGTNDPYLHEFFVEDEDFTDLEFVVEVIKFCVVAAALFEEGFDDAPNFVVKVILKVCFDDDQYKAFRAVGCHV